MKLEVRSDGVFSFRFVIFQLIHVVDRMLR